MAGEIRNKLAQLRASRDRFHKALDACFTEADAAHGDAHDALKLVEAETRAIKEETRELRGEFVEKTNAPPEPLTSWQNGKPHGPG